MFRVGDKVRHVLYGKGEVIYVQYRGHNIGVKFENGGPQGFAPHSSHDVKDLVREDFFVKG
jgi:hypothetical protein